MTVRPRFSVFDFAFILCLCSQLAELLIKEAENELFSGKHADPSPMGPTLEETLQDCDLDDIDDIEVGKGSVES